MEANELQRIYQLQTAGLPGVLADINNITDAFRKSSEAAASLGGSRSAFDTNQLIAVNRQLEKMVDIQDELLITLKGISAESSKVNANFNGLNKSSDMAANGMEDLSAAAKVLGSNLSGTTPQLLKLQTTLNTGSMQEYEAAILSLTKDLVDVRVELQANTKQYAFNARSSDDLSEAQVALMSTIIRQKQEVSELTKAIGTLNTQYIGGARYLGEYAQDVANATVANKQNTESLILNAKAEQEVIDKAIELGIIKKGVNSEIKAGIYSGSGQQAIDEQAKIDKMLAEHELYQTKLAELDTKLADKVRVQGLLNLVGQEASLPENKAAIKVDQQVQRTQIELLKNQSIAADETAAHMQRLAAQINVYRIQLRLMSEEDRKNPLVGGVMANKTKVLDDELRGLNKTVGDSTRDIGKYGLALGGVTNIQGMFTRQLIRGIGSLIIWGALFGALSKVYEELMLLIPGTDDYIKKQRELEQVLENTESTMLSLTTTTDAFRKSLDEAFGTGEEGYQQYLDALKGIGVVQGKVYESELNQHQAIQALRDKQIENLDILSTKYYKLNQIFQEIDKYRDLGVVKKEVAGLGLSDEDAKKYQEILDDFLKARKDDPALKLYGNATITKAIADTQAKSQLLAQQKIDAQATFDAKYDRQQYERNIELKKQLAQTDEQYRQEKEKEDINSISKITADTAAKYKLLADDINKNRETYRLSMTSKEDVGYTDNNILAYDRLLKVIKNIGVEERKNKIFEYSKAKLLSDENFDATYLGNAAGVSKFNADYGGANYGKMSDAIEADIKSKKEAILNEALQLELDNKNRIPEIEKQKTDKLIQIDKQGYKDRLQLGLEYFKKLQTAYDSEAAHITSLLDAKTTSDILDVLYGKGSKYSKARKVDRITDSGIIEKANNDIITAQTALGTTGSGGLNDALDKAKNSESKADTKDKLAEAKKVTVAIQGEIDIQNKKALDAELLKKQTLDKQKEQNKQYLQQIKDGGIQIAETAANAYMQLLAKQDAYRAEMMHRSLDYNIKVMESQTRSNNQQLTNQRAANLASQEIDKEKAQRDQKRAEQQIIVNGVIAISKAWADSADPIAAAIETGVIIGEMGVEEAMLAKAPAYARGVRSHPGGWAWIGDGRENELLRLGNQIAISPSTPTLANLPAGTEVTPFSKLASIPGDMGASLKAPSFVSTSSASGSNGVNIDAHEQAIHQLYGIVGQMGKHLSNLNINYDSVAAGRAAVRASYKRKSI